MKNEHELYVVYSLNVTTDQYAAIKPGKPLFFSSRANAEDVIRRYRELYAFLYDEASQGEKVYCLILETYALDSPYRYQLATRVYTPDGRLVNDSLVPDDAPFYGRPKGSIQHQVGDLVEVPCGDRLLIGIVASQPICLCEGDKPYGLSASDDCYTIIQHPDLEINYAHAPLVFKPSRTVDTSVSDSLFTALKAYTHQESY